MKVASWNIEGRLTRFAKVGERGSPEHIIEGIKRLDSDVVFLPEAYDGERPIEPAIINNLKQMGYRCVEAPYKEAGERKYSATADPHMMLLSRLKIVDSDILPCIGGVRNMLTVDVLDPSAEEVVRIFGIHLDDRSEQIRLQQVDDLLPYIADSPFPVIAMGDFNAMHGSSIQARFLRNRAVLGAINHLPFPRTKDLLQRLSEMAIGSTLHNIETKTNLQCTDPKMRPTATPKMRGQEWMPSVRMVQIDHTFVSPQIAVNNFTVAEDNGSDHRAISMTTRQS